MKSQFERSYRTAVFMAVLFFLASFPLFAGDTGLAKTPPMGWNSWNKFACDINETLIKQIADAMVSSGMKDAGYQYVVLDDCWMAHSRDSAGKLVADSMRFPSGIKALANYVHSKGLKLGIYEDRGSATCQGFPGSYGHEADDANTFASWGVDYLKYDNCHKVGDLQSDYTKMRNALDSCGRPIVFSICSWSFPGPWVTGIGNLWRTTEDISADFAEDINHGTWTQLSILSIIDAQDSLRQYAGPGHWNDPDMLEVGNGMTNGEDRAHFSIWCMLAAPLMAGNDLRTMAQRTKEILMNKEVIAVDQDPLGIEGFRFSSKDSVEIFFKPLAKGDWAMCFLNRGVNPKNVSFGPENGDVTDTLSGITTGFQHIAYAVRDLWSHKGIGTSEKDLKAVVPGHDVLMLRLTPVKK
ncbi:MAG: glycoside hydrolase family 27 protein [Bacteroidota bacterium]|nr:glycoside hydrolase family 27 protein [Bacteroidota bacterium]